MDFTTETLSGYHRRHHCDGGFRNLDAHEQRPVSLLRGLLWFLRRLFNEKEHAPPAVHRPDADALREPPDRLRLTWIGHTTVLIQTPHVTLLTDPVFADRASPVPFAGPRRFIPPALTLDALPPVDVVLLSHDHYDHCDRASLERLYRDHAPAFVVPLGVANRLRAWGLGPAVELDWWQRATAPTAPGHVLRLTCTPARHFSGRTLSDRNATLWASWMIETGPAPAARNGSASAPLPLRVYFGGDTGDGPHFAEIRARLGAPEVALLPIGAYLPREMMAPVHIGPKEALDAFDALGAEHLVPTHWGTFDLAEETVQAPAERLRALAAQRDLTERLRIPAPGEPLAFPVAAGDDDAAERSAAPS